MGAALLFLTGSCTGRVPAGVRTFYVSTNGPIHSLADAIELARLARREGAAKVEIYLHRGTYVLDQPLVLTPEDSGLTVAACRFESPVVSGQTVIGGWKCSPTNGTLWQTKIDDPNWNFHELFMDGRRQARTRVPERGFFHAVGPGVPGQPDELQFRLGEIQSAWAGPGDVEVVTYEAWAQTRNQIRAVIAQSNIVTLAGRALANGSERNPRYFIENAPVPLQPGQWYFDRRRRTLSYCATKWSRFPNATMTAPHLNELILLKGTVDSPVHDITFRGLTFSGTDWALHGGSDIDVQAAVERPGAVQAEFANDCAFEKCTFEHLGGYGLELGRGCERDRVMDNEMQDLGAGGVRAGQGKENGSLQDSFNFPCGHHLISGNHIHHIGAVNAPGVGIFVLLSGNNRIASNEVDHTFYTAVSVGWSWGFKDTPCRSNIVEFNHLHDIGQGMLSDMGGIYTLGVQPGTIICNNRIHDVRDFIYGGWGLYTDEGSSGIVLESNIVYRCQSAGFHQHYGLTNIIRNNVFALNREAQLARTRLEPGISFIFTNNIVYFDSGRLFWGQWGDDLEMDRNLYFDTRKSDHKTWEDFRSWQEHGHDIYSLYTDPLFANPHGGNFCLKPNSPALRMGFGQVDVSETDVRPRLH